MSIYESLHADAAAQAAAVAAGNQRVTGFNGDRNEGRLAVSEIAGVVGGILGGVACYAQGSSKTGALVGAVLGGVGGYAMGNLLSIVSDINGTTKILTGLTAGCFGVSVAQVGACLADSIGNLSGE